MALFEVRRDHEFRRCLCRAKLPPMSSDGLLKVICAECGEHWDVEVRGGRMFLVSLSEDQKARMLGIASRGIAVGLLALLAVLLLAWVLAPLLRHPS